MVDYKIIQIIDVVINEQEIRLYIPKVIKTSDIQAISPLTTSKGRLLKHSTILETYHDKIYMIVGNYQDHINNIKNNKSIGFKGKNY